MIVALGVVGACCMCCCCWWLRLCAVVECVALVALLLVLFVAGVSVIVDIVVDCVVIVGNVGDCCMGRCQGMLHGSLLLLASM